jgi:radical SAM protein with 4Fe4S-binding SPASM domain
MRRYIEISTAIGCVNDCAYCPRELSIQRYRQRSEQMRMPYETFCLCLDKVPRNHSVYFSGFVEPSQNPDFIRMVQYAWNSGRRLGIFTTLARLVPHQINALANLTYDSFVIHVQSGEERFVPHDELIPRLQAAMTVKGAEFIHRWPLETDVADAIEGGHVHRFLPNTRAGSLGPVPRRTGRLTCTTGRNARGHILLPNGDVVLCCQDFGQTVILGNLLLDSFESLHQGEQWMSYQEKMKAQDSDLICRECECAASILSASYLSHLAKSPLRQKATFRMMDNYRHRINGGMQ